MQRRRVLVLPSLVAMVVSLAACAPAAPSPAAPAEQPAAKAEQPATKAEQPAAEESAAKEGLSPEIQELIAAAEENGETELKLVYTTGDYGGAQGAKEFEQVMNDLYGTNFKVNFTPGPDKNDRLGMVLQEFSAGQTPSSDVVLLSPSMYGELYRAEAMESYEWTQLDENINPNMVAKEGIAVEVNTRAPGITYNKEVISDDEAPRKLADVFSNPDWKGRITTHERAAQLDTIMYRPEWGPEKFTEYVCQLSQWIGGVTGGEPERLASQEFIMMVVSPGPHDVLPAMAKGAPLGFIVPEDGAVLSVEYAGVPKGAENPNLAKLYINALLSPAGQRLMYKYTFLDHSELPGSQSAALLEDVKAKGIEFLRSNVQFELDHPEKNDYGDRFVEILSRNAPC